MSHWKARPFAEDPVQNGDFTALASSRVSFSGLQPRGRPGPWVSHPPSRRAGVQPLCSGARLAAPSGRPPRQPLRPQAPAFLGFGSPFPAAGVGGSGACFWQSRDQVPGEAAAAPLWFLKPHRTWARGEPFPPEAPAGRVGSKVQEQSLPRRLGLCRGQGRSLMGWSRSRAWDWGTGSGETRNRGLCSQQQSDDGRKHYSPNAFIKSSVLPGSRT